MEFLDKELEEYIESHTQPESDLLKKVNRETHAQVLKPRMLSGHLQGRILAMLTGMIRPKRILEIGTYTGYSALCMLEELPEDGILYTLDINEELEKRVRSYFQESGKSNQVRYIIANALEEIPKMEESWDMVFIDADKINYSNYYDMVIDKVRKGGYIIADNVLWSGKVLEKNRKKLDADTEAIMEFNNKMHQDNRVQNVLFPVRDGLMILKKL